MFAVYVVRKCSFIRTQGRADKSNLRLVDERQQLLNDGQLLLGGKRWEIL